MLISLGCRPFRLITTLVYEALVLGLSGVVLGTLVGGAWVCFQGVHGISFGNLKDFAMEGIRLHTIFPYLQPLDIVRSVVCVALTSLLAVWWPAKRIAKMDALEAMRS
jgi:ABC-type lipoprotein release transport system permease subunit